MSDRARGADTREPILVGWLGTSDVVLITGPHSPALIEVIQRYTTSGYTVRAPGASGEFIYYTPYNREAVA